MNLPPIHNKRSPQQWEIISKEIDFKGKWVIDLGCGYGDILFRCWDKKATCLGIDDKIIAQVGNREGIRFEKKDIEVALLSSEAEFRYEGWDVSICFSVLPYLKNPALVLQWMHIHSNISLIEIQSSGDGPGTLKTKDDIKEYLFSFFPIVKCIGKTVAKKDKDYDRFIWLCQ